MAPKMEPWKVQHSRVLLERKWLTVREEHVILANGHEIDEFHVIDSASWAAALAFTADDRLLVVDQYRHGIGRVSRELPAGVIDRGETPLAAVRRELLEETGYTSADWHPLITLATEPSRHTALAHFFVARAARRTADPCLDESEALTVHAVKPSELSKQIESGLICHATHVAALGVALQRGLFD